MKNKKGFTLVELLAVIAILAILVIIALPNVLNMFRNTKKNTFTDEVQNLVKSAENKYLTNSMNNISGEMCFDSKNNKLDMTGRDNIIYKIKLSETGKLIEVSVADDNYELIAYEEAGINRVDLGNKYEVKTRNKATEILDCNNNALIEGEETGEENAPYKIQFIDDLVELSNNVENGETYEGKTFVLTRNLDFQNKDSYKDKENSELYNQVTTGTGFTPIGVGDNHFKGNFDGKNHRIDNLYIKNTDTEDLALGLFGKIENSTISNLTVGGSIEIGSNRSNAGMISNVYGNSKVINCTNEINITSESTDWTLGGIAATLESSEKELIIESCINKGQISGGKNTGGIIGWIVSNGKVTITNSENQNIISNSTYIGGLVGRADKQSTLIITNSNNNAEVKFNSEISKISIGGLIGYLNVDSNSIITNSNNNGKITINSNSDFNAGGLVGYISGKVNINNSHNKNTITSYINNNIGRTIGGLIGTFASTLTSTITNSSNEETSVISGGNRVGGLIGDCQAGLIINNCYNLANISSSDAWSSTIDVGGLLGDVSGWSIEHDDIIILNSYNKGNINVSIDNYASSAGGLIGAQIGSNPSNAEDTSTSTKIINSYNQGNITLNGTTTENLYANGIMVIALKSVTLNNLYNIGSLNSIKYNNVITNNNSNVTTNYKNVYYLNTLNGTKPDDTINVIGKSESEMKNQTFVTLLNSNKSGIDLSNVDSRLSGYTLCNWKLGNSGYPELDCN